MKFEFLGSFVLLASFARAQDREVSARTYYDTVGSCTDAEFTSIFGPTLVERRTLSEPRQLGCFQSSCYKKNCVGWPGAECYAVYGCPACARNLEEGEESLLIVSSCDVVVAEIENKHVSAFPKLSDSCKEKVATRKMECYDVLTEEIAGSNTINSFTLWNADSDVAVTTNLVNGASFCENNFAFSIEAVAGKNVRQVNFELYGVLDYNYVHAEYGAPFTMFAEVDQDIQGAKYKAGDYDLIATPNGDASKALYLRFTIKPSTHLDCVPPPPPCSAEKHRGECSWYSGKRTCQKKYKNLGADRCDHSVCYCKGAVCGCL